MKKTSLVKVLSSLADAFGGINSIRVSDIQNHLKENTIFFKTHRKYKNSGRGCKSCNGSSNKFNANNITSKAEKARYARQFAKRMLPPTMKGVNYDYFK